MLKASKRRRKLYLLLVFLVRFSLMVIPLYILEYLADMSLLQTEVANEASFFLNLIGVQTTVFFAGIPVLLVGNSLGIGIINACTAYRSIFAYLALVFAVPNVKIKRRLKALLFGIPIIYVANIARLVTTILVGLKLGVTLLDLTHIVLWREALILLVFGLWVLWARNLDAFQK